MVHAAEGGVHDEHMIYTLLSQAKENLGGEIAPGTPQLLNLRVQIY